MSLLTIEWVHADAAKPVNVREWECVISIAMDARGKVVMRHDGNEWIVSSASRVRQTLGAAGFGFEGLENMRHVVANQLRAHTAWTAAIAQLMPTLSKGARGETDSVQV